MMESDEAARKEARERAIARVAAELGQPDTLDRVEQIRFKHFNKKVSMETQLKTLVTSQLKEAREGIDKLNSSLKTLGKVRKSALNVYDLAAETQSLITHYSVAQKVNIARINLTRTRNQLTSMLTIPTKVRSIQKLMEDDINILRVRREVRMLEKARDVVLKQAEDHPDQQLQLKELFMNVNELSKQFEDKLWSLLADHMRLAKDRPEVLVKVLQVLNREDKRMQAATAASNAAAAAALTVEDFDGAPVPQARRIANHDKYFTESYEKLFVNIRDRFWGYVDQTKNKNDGLYDVTELIKMTHKLIEDLEHVFDYVVLCFPPKYNILDLYVTIYHQALFQLFTEISKTAPQREFSPQDTLNLVKWVKSFWIPQMSRLGVDEKEPNLLEALDMLIDEFKSRIFSLMEEWTKRIVATDRDHDPDIINGVYYTLAPHTLFTFIHQQIDIAKGTSTDLLLFVTVDACRKIVELYQTLWMKKFEGYRDNVGSAKNPEIQYVIAHVNNNSKCYDYLLDLETSLADLKDEYRAALQFDQMKDGFQQLLKLTRQVLVAYIFKDIEEVFSKLFTKEWVEQGEQVEEIKGTFEDYFGSVIRGHLLSSYFNKFALECLEKVVSTYLLELLTKKHSFTRAAVDRFSDDISKCHEFFVSWEVKDKLVAGRLAILKDFVQLLSDHPDAMNSLFRRMLDNAPDLVPQIIELTLNMRDDLDRKQVRSAVDKFREVQDSRPVVADIPADSIFAIIKARLK